MEVSIPPDRQTGTSLPLSLSLQLPTMSSAASPPVQAPPGSSGGGPPPITSLFGPLLIGILLNTLMFGVLIVQTYIYYHQYKSDRRWFKILVAYLLFMETANWVCDVGIVYEPLILRYGTPGALITSPLMLIPDGAMTVLISTPIQIFMAWRIHVVTHNWLVPGLIVATALGSLAGGIGLTVVVAGHRDFASFASFKPEVITWLGCSAACDVFLTASLVLSLWNRRGGIASASDANYINRIIRLTVQTGFMTATAALLDCIIYIALPGTTYNFIIDFPLSKIYSNTLISTLNARPWRQEGLKADEPNALFEQTPDGHSHSSSFALASRDRRSAHVIVSRSTQAFSDALPLDSVSRSKYAMTPDAESGYALDDVSSQTKSQPRFQPDAPTRVHYPPRMDEHSGWAEP
ncbi:unnamed protein product [Mycena citricolor]|uniref:DUF6534 domain-containing protein n=1 Tax=Mycena citricolor TaxID=2018698 RepID=A0AAD2I259_9AGAR|nr:unnamed protein product [Mycena citricolor]